MCQLFISLLVVGWFTHQNGAYADAFVAKSPLQRRGHLGEFSKLRTPSQPSVDFHGSSLEEFPVTTLRSGGSETSKQPFWTKTLFRELLAEFIGTGLIVGLGTGAVMSAIFSEALVGLWQIAVVWAIAVTIAIATTGPISGAHLNPAVSIAFALLRPSKAFGWSKVLPYSMAQTLGAATFSWISSMIYGSTISAFEIANGIKRGSEASIASAKAFGEYFV